MKKIDLNELYGGYWLWECFEKGKCDNLEVKPLREHIKEWLKLAIDGEKLSSGCLNGKGVELLQNILDGNVTELDNEDGIIKMEYGFNDYNELLGEPIYEYDAITFEPIPVFKERIRDYAIEQGIKPQKTWYRQEVDSIALQAAHPYDDLPF